MTNFTNTVDARSYCTEGGPWIATMWSGLESGPQHRLRMLSALYPYGITCGQHRPADLTHLESLGLLDETRNNHWKANDTGKLVAAHGRLAQEQSARNPQEGDDCIYPDCDGEKSVADVGDGLVCLQCGFHQELEPTSEGRVS